MDFMWKIPRVFEAVRSVTEERRSTWTGGSSISKNFSFIAVAQVPGQQPETTWLCFAQSTYGGIVDEVTDVAFWDWEETVIRCIAKVFGDEAHEVALLVALSRLGVRVLEECAMGFRLAPASGGQCRKYRKSAFAEMLGQTGHARVQVDEKLLRQSGGVLNKIFRMDITQKGIGRFDEVFFIMANKKRPMSVWCTQQILPEPIFARMLPLAKQQTAGGELPSPGCPTHSHCRRHSGLN
jgi:hypothetical protein